MESHITKPLQSYPPPPPLDSLDDSKTLPSSPPPPPPLVDTANSSGLSNCVVPDSDLEGEDDDDDDDDDDCLLDGNDSDDMGLYDNEIAGVVQYHRRRNPRWSQPWANIHDEDKLSAAELAYRFDDDYRAPHRYGDDYMPMAMAMRGYGDHYRAMRRHGDHYRATRYDRSWHPPDVNRKPSFTSLQLSGCKPPIVGAGLANLGNTCFLNAVMQCFTHTVPLLMVLASCKHITCQSRDSRSGKYCVLCALSELLTLSFNNGGKVVAPWAFVNNLNYFSSSFWRYQQEDAHEFLQCFLDKLENRWNDAMMMGSSDESSNIVNQVFGGRLVSRLRCCNCDHCSCTTEPSIDLSLEIEDADTLYGALDSFTKVEKIDDSEMKFTCENCKEQVSVEKQLLLDQAPSVAAFHLKRFKSDGSFVEKLDKHVSFPLELDLCRYTAGCQSAELKYDLYAVVVHTGFSSNSGHYYCFIRSAPQMWYKFDDDQVTWVEEESVLSQEAYILFYAKKETPSFASFYEKHFNSMNAPVVNTSPKSVFDNMDASTSSSSLPSECPNDGHETNDAADEASTVTKEKPESSRADEHENEENRMPDLAPLAVSNSSMEISCDAKDEKPEGRTDKHENEENCMPDPAPLAVSNSSMAIPCNAKEEKPECKTDEREDEENCMPDPDLASLAVSNSSMAIPCNAKEEKPECRIDECENEDNCMPDLAPLVVSNLSIAIPCNAKEDNSNDVASNDTQTRPRSPSPVMHREDPPDQMISSPGGHSESAEPNKEEIEDDDSERNLALAYVKNKMPEARGLKMMAPLGGSHSEGAPVSKKRGRGLHMLPYPHHRNSRHKAGNLRSNVSSFR